MVHGVEIGGNQIHGTRQAQAADVLLEEADIWARAIPCRHRKHFRRAIYSEDRNTPALAQIASKQAGAATDVRCGGKSYFVPPDEPFEGSACSDEVPNPKGDIISWRETAVGPSEVRFRYRQLHCI